MSYQRHITESDELDGSESISEESLFYSDRI